MTRRSPDSGRYLALSNDPLRTDPEFCRLPLQLQGLEIALRRDGSRSTCGVHPVRLRPWTRLAPSLTAQEIESGIRALAEAGRCVVDWEEEEVYWLGYVSQQPGIASYRYAKGLLKAVRDIQSRLIRTCVVEEMASIPLSSVAVPTSDARFAAAAAAVRDAWQALVATAGEAVGVSIGVSEPGHSNQDTGHSTQSTGGGQPEHLSVDSDGHAGERSQGPANSLVRASSHVGEAAAAVTAAWWRECGHLQATARHKVEAAVAAVMASTGASGPDVHQALTFVATEERRGITEGTLRVGLDRLKKQPKPATSNFAAEAERLARAAAVLEGRPA